MTTTEIKIEILRKGVSISELARRWNCYSQEISMCIHGRRKYPRLRKRLAKHLGKSVKELFGERVVANSEVRAA